MGPQVSVQQVLSSTGTAYNSFHIRTLAIEIEGNLHNLATVIEFSRWPLEILKKNREIQLNDNRIRKGPIVPLQNFHSSSDWPETIADFKAGRLLFDKNIVALVGELDLNALSSRIGMGGFVENESPYPLFEAMSVPGTQEQRDAARDNLRILEVTAHGEALEMQMSRSGYHSYREFLHARFGARSETEPTPGAVYVAIHVPAVANDCFFDSGKGVLRARAIIAPELLDATWIHGRMFFRDPKASYEIRFGAFNSEPNAANSPDFVYCLAEWDLLKRCEYLDLRVVHHELGIVQSTRITPSQLLPASYSNPLLVVLKRFCPTQYIEQMLIAPEAEKNGTPKPQRTHEQYVQWLLSMCGFIAINLRAHEHLHDLVGDSKVRRGSLDIIAFHPESRIILLASCTLKAPDEGDYSNLVNLRVALNLELGATVGVETKLAIFTTASAVAPDPRYGDSEHYVAVFDLPRISALVEECSNSEHPTLYRILNGGRREFHSLLSQ